jgi:hypothetical protein
MSTTTPAAPPHQAPLPSLAGPITRARARDLNFVMLLKNEGPEVLFYVSLSYSRTRANLRCLRVFRTPPSSNRLDCSHLVLVRSSIAHRKRSS